jgi:hypothetical protein
MQGVPLYYSFVSCWRRLFWTKLFQNSERTVFFGFIDKAWLSFAIAFVMCFIIGNY